jgi:REP element-mobilizing transposase RayT
MKRRPYRVYEHHRIHFITLTVIDWIDIFTRPTLAKIIVDALDYSRKDGQLEIYAWCLMSNHLHVVCCAGKDFRFGDVMRNFKSNTSKQLIQQIKREGESRRSWMLPAFKHATAHLKRPQNFKVWKTGYHALTARDGNALWRMIFYTHNNPVKAGWVELPEDYMYSSARNYAGRKALIPIDQLSYLTISGRRHKLRQA